MCWYSVEHSRRQVLEAETGERLCVRLMHGSSRWVVKESEFTASNPRPVCLLNGTSVLFRPTEAQQTEVQLEPETEAVFRMLTQPKRDVFEWPDGKQVEVNNLPPGLLFDVMVVPGKPQGPTIAAGDEEAIEELAAAEIETTAAEPIMASIRRFWRVRQ